MDFPEIQLTSHRFQHLAKMSLPNTLFHYTTQAGLLGIITSRAHQATKVQYMNDATEFALFISLAKSILWDRIGDFIDDQELFKSCFEHLNYINMINIHAVSFCRDGDLLSQWRGYAAAGGYAIGFSPSAALLSIGGGCRIGRCIYEKSDQVSILNELIDEMLSYKSKVRSEDCTVVLSTIFGSSLIEYGAFFKDASFIEEDEWRLITDVRAYTDEKIGFRAGKSMLIPYYCLDIYNGSWRDKIDNVVVGPCPHPSIAKASVEGLLLRYSVINQVTQDGVPHYPEVQASAIPYRNW